MSRRESKEHYRSRAGIPEPLTREDTAYAKRRVMKILDEGIEACWASLLDEDRAALKIQRDRVARIMGAEPKYT